MDGQEFQVKHAEIGAAAIMMKLLTPSGVSTQ